MGPCRRCNNWDFGPSPDGSKETLHQACAQAEGGIILFSCRRRRLSRFRTIQIFATDSPPGRACAILATSRARASSSRTGQTRDGNAFEDAFQAAAKEDAEAVAPLPAPLMDANAVRIAELALKHQLPTMCHTDVLPRAGGLMSYGVSLVSVYKRAAYYVDRILKGARPADLPVEQPTKFELVVNLKTAKALGLVVPPTLLATADEVIE